MYFHATIGNLLNSIEDNMKNITASLPYQIRRSEDRMKWLVCVAVGGFEKEELSVETKNNILLIKGMKKSNKSRILDWKNSVLVAGNLFCDFSLSFNLNEHMEVNRVEFNNGLLEISLHVNLPEEKKTKRFEIN